MLRKQTKKKFQKFLNGTKLIFYEKQKVKNYEYDIFTIIIPCFSSKIITYFILYLIVNLTNELHKIKKQN